jgi:hypothetical protein
MKKTFSYDPNTSNFLIASHVYGDFGVQIPLIRSFSMGNNFPFEMPYFAGSGLKYHFMFDLFVGILEYLGLRIDYAINLLSTVLFSCLLMMIYTLGKRLFNSRGTGILATLFFLFPSDLSFIEFFKRFGLRLSTPFYFWNNTSFYVNGFLGDNTISTFISLNNYLNQRQLIFAKLFTLCFGSLLFDSFSKKVNLQKLVFLGILLGLLPLWHALMFLVIIGCLLSIMIFHSFSRKKIFTLLVVTLIIAFPQIMYINKDGIKSAAFMPGFLISRHLTVTNFIAFWIMNLGLAIPIMIIGYFVSNQRQRKIFLTALPLFIIPNLFKFSQEIFDNHKFFNLWIIIVDLFIAYAIVSLWRKKLMLKLLSLVLIFFLTLSGFLNLLVTKNDVYTRISDYPGNSLMSWVNSNISKKEIIITNGEIYDPVSLLGQKVFIGGGPQIINYNVKKLNDRMNAQNEILNSNSFGSVKKILSDYQIRYLVLYHKGFAKNVKKTNYQFFKSNFTIEYEDQDGFVVKI